MNCPCMRSMQTFVKIFPLPTVACDGRADLAIILDISGSIRYERFGDVKQFLVDAISEMEVWQDKIRIALITFHDDARLEFGLNFYTHVQVSILWAILTPK